MGGLMDAGTPPVEAPRPPTARVVSHPRRGRAPRHLARHLAATLAVAASLKAHPGTWHTIELLSEQIAHGDHRAALFYARGSEYRCVEQWKEAEADLLASLVADPGFFPARKDLGPVLLAAGRREDALAAALVAVRLATDRPAPSQASAWVELARIQKAGADWQGVVRSTDEALKLVPRGEVDWHLLREEAFRAQGNLAQAIDDLARGDARLRSSLLRAAWLDALLEAGRATETLVPIEAAMVETRHRAPWLVRRARARTLLGQIKDARGDWEAALSELAERLDPGAPDPSLLVLQGMCFAGLGRREEAVHALKAARAISSDPILLSPLTREIGPSPAR